MVNFHLLKGIYIPNFRKFHQTVPKIICHGRTEGRTKGQGWIYRSRRFATGDQLGVDFNASSKLGIFLGPQSWPAFFTRPPECRSDIFTLICELKVVSKLFFGLNVNFSWGTQEIIWNSKKWYIWPSKLDFVYFDPQNVGTVIVFLQHFFYFLKKWALSLYWTRFYYHIMPSIKGNHLYFSMLHRVSIF